VTLVPSLPSVQLLKEPGLQIGLAGLGLGLFLDFEMGSSSSIQ